MTDRSDSPFGRAASNFCGPQSWWRFNSSIAASAASGAMANKKAAGSLRGSNSKARYSSGTPAANETQSPREIEIVVQAACDHSWRAASNAPGRTGTAWCWSSIVTEEIPFSGSSERHFTGVAQDTESSDVGDRVNRAGAIFCGDFVKRFRRGAIQLRHRNNGGIHTCFWRRAPFLARWKSGPCQLAWSREITSFTSAPTFLQIFFGWDCPVTA